MTDSFNDELEKLKKQRAMLESKLLAHWKHRTPFEVEAEIVREKVAIQELKKELDRVNDRAPKANPEKINIGELEDKLKSTKEFATSGITQKSEAEAKDEIDKPETDEQTRTIWKKNEQIPESTKPPEDESKKSPEEQEKKKKLKIF